MKALVINNSESERARRELDIYTRRFFSGVLPGVSSSKDQPG
jgi:hypothetical protein